jgi:putative sterol carrier protein
MASRSPSSVCVALGCLGALAGCNRGEPASLTSAVAVGAVVTPKSTIAVHSVAEYFDTLDRRFVPAAARGMHAVYEFDLGTGGIYQVMVDDGTMQVAKGASRHADTVLSMNGDDYVRMVNGQINGTAAYFGGRLKIAGNMTLARRMSAIFPPN